MRKFIGVILAALMLGQTMVMASRYADVDDSYVYSSAIENLSNYGIVSGYNGSFNPYGSITRAEAAKIAAVTGGVDDEAATKAGVKKFADVEIGHWSCGYINAASDNGYILGYPNGYYMPDNNITYAEMTTIVLRLLGYDSDVLGDNWPYAYMYKARELGITDGISLGDFDTINRAQTCKLIDNALGETVYGKGVKLSQMVSPIKYSEPIVMKNTDFYVDLSAFDITSKNISDYKIIRDGQIASFNDIRLYDVVYKSKSNNTLYVYCDKLSGVYKEAFPSKADAASVDISGTVLELETQTAKDKLGEKLNSYKYNSRITCLLGMDGRVVDAVDINSAGNGDYGVLLSYTETISEDTENKGELKKYINILDSSGQEISYETKKDYTNHAGYVGKISVDAEGMASFMTQSNKTDLTGVIDKNKRKIGDTYLTEDATIIELVYAAETHTGNAVAKVIDIDDIVVDKLTQSNVIYALKGGEFGDVSFAVLSDVTNDSYTYGILKSMKSMSMGMSVQASYTVLSHGTEKVYNASFIQNLSGGTPVAMVIENGMLVSVSGLKNEERGTLEAIDELRIKIGSEIYDTANDVQIYCFDAGAGYTSLSVNQAKEYTGNSAAVYTDIKTVSGGLARVIVIYK